jgi:hypothetical protein
MAARHYRFVGAVRDGPYAVWFRAHWLLSVLGAAATVSACGFGISYAATAVTHGAAHFRTAHGALSLATTLLIGALTAASLAPARPAWPALAASIGVGKPAAGENDNARLATAARRWQAWSVVHAVGGAAVLLLGVAVLLTGAATVPSRVGGVDAPASAAAVTLCALWIALSVAVVLAHEVLLQRRARDVKRVNADRGSGASSDGARGVVSMRRPASAVIVPVAGPSPLSAEEGGGVGAPHVTLSRGAMRRLRLQHASSVAAAAAGGAGLRAHPQSPLAGAPLAEAAALGATESRGEDPAAARSGFAPLRAYQARRPPPAPRIAAVVTSAVYS